MSLTFGKFRIIAALLLVAVILGCSNWTKENIAESQRRGDVIVAAIEKFHADNKQYPPTLDQLLPKYLSKIDPPIAGNGKWIYTDNGGGGYFLGFGGDNRDGDPLSYRANTLNGWVIDTR